MRTNVSTLLFVAGSFLAFGAAAAEPAGDRIEPAGNKIDPAGRVIEPAVNPIEPAGNTAKPAGRAIDPEAIIRSYLNEDQDEPVQIRSFSRPVKANSCRTYNRSKGTWVPVEVGVIALHVRYRKPNAAGFKPLHSEVFFLDDDGGIAKIAEAAAVRCSDPALLK